MKRIAHLPNIASHGWLTKAWKRSRVPTAAEMFEPDHEGQRKSEEYEKLSKASLAEFRRRIAQIRGSCKSFLQSGKLTKRQEDYIRRESDSIIYAYKVVKILFEKPSSPLTRFMITQSMSNILFSSINLAPYFPEIARSVNRERNSRGGRARGEQLRNAVKNRWRDDALKFFEELRGRLPEISQANLAKTFVDARTNEDSYCPQEESVVLYIRDLERTGLLKRRISSKTTA